MYGWIDGLINKWDEQYYLVRFTQRRPKSNWSKINREIAKGLLTSKKMQPSGKREIEAAKKDGRWDAAYDSSATMEVPPELAKLLRKNSKAKRFFDSISRANRYAFLYRIQTAKKVETTQKWVAKTMEMLERGEVLHPNH